MIRRGAMLCVIITGTLRKYYKIPIHGVEEIVAVRTFRSRLPVRRVRHMDRRGQEVQNNFLTDHIIRGWRGRTLKPSPGDTK